MEIEQRFQTPLAYLCLIGGVRGIPIGVLKDIAQDDCWGIGAIIATADERAHELVLTSLAPELFGELPFAQGGGETKRLRETDVIRDNLLDKLVKRLYADGGEHLVDLLRAIAYMPRVKFLLCHESFHSI